MLISRRDEFGEIGNFGWTHVLLLLLMGEFAYKRRVRISIYMSISIQITDSYN